jgi:hypothetical protein
MQQFFHSILHVYNNTASVIPLSLAFGLACHEDDALFFFLSMIS